MRKYQPWLRYPKTAQEIRNNSVDKDNLNADLEDKLYRNRRSASLLPTVYDDIFVVRKKDWKKRRKTQYHDNTSKKHRHFIILKDKNQYYNLTTYLQDRDIAYKTKVTKRRFLVIWWYEKDIGVKYII